MPDDPALQVASCNGEAAGHDWGGMGASPPTEPQMAGFGDCLFYVRRKRPAHILRWPGRPVVQNQQRLRPWKRGRGRHSTAKTNGLRAKGSL